MAQTLNSFYQAAQDYGFSRDYQARITGLVINGNEFNINRDPEGLAPNGEGISDKPLLYIKDFSIPSVKRIVSTVKYLGADIHSVGPRTFGDNLNWSVTFYSDQNLLLRQWLEARLIESATNTDGRKNYNPVPGSNSYATIDIVNDNLETVLQYKLEGLFVVDIPSSSYDLAGNGAIQQFKATFGYQKWTNIPVKATDYEVGSSSSRSTGAAESKKGFLDTLTGGLKAIAGAANAVSRTANAVRNTATSVRSARRSIRGR